MVKRAIVVLLVGLIALYAVPAALPQNDTSKAGYGGESAVQVTLVESGQASAQATQSVASQSLPVTGLDIGVFLVGGSILVLVGLGMRRLARQRQ